MAAAGAAVAVAVASNAAPPPVLCLVVGGKSFVEEERDKMTGRLTKPHPQDEESLNVLRRHLRQIRLDRGISSAQLSRDMGRSAEAVSQLEVRDRTPLMSTLQRWAAGLGLRIEFGLQGWSELVFFDPRTQGLFEASRPWGADEQMRLWLISALRTWRVARGVELSELGLLLGTTPHALHQWEVRTRDPFMFRAMWQARHLDTRVTMQVRDKDLKPV